MKSSFEILTKLEILSEAKHNLAMKEEKTDFERLYIKHLEAGIKELMWVMDMNELSDEEIKAKNDEEDRMAGFADDMKEEKEEKEEYDDETL